MSNLYKFFYIRRLTFIIVYDTYREQVFKVRLHHFLGNSIATLLVVNSMRIEYVFSQIGVNIALGNNMPIFFLHSLAQCFNVKESIHPVIVDSLNIIFGCGLYCYLPLCRSCIKKSHVYILLLHKSI